MLILYAFTRGIEFVILAEGNGEILSGGGRIERVCLAAVKADVAINFDG